MRIKRTIKRLFGSYKKPTIITLVFPSLIIDVVTTLHVLRRDEEAETGQRKPVAESKERRSNYQTSGAIGLKKDRKMFTESRENFTETVNIFLQNQRKRL